MSSFGEYYHKNVRHEWDRLGRGKHVEKSQARRTPTLRTLHERLDLAEAIQQIIQGLNDIVQPAEEFMKQELADRSNLPDDSPEIGFLNGLLGVMQQYTPTDVENLDQGMLREKIIIMSDKIEAMVGEDSHGDHGVYATKLVSGLRRFANRIDPTDDGETPPEEDAPPDEMGGEAPPEEGEEGPPPEDDGGEGGPPPEGEEEEEPDEASKLAQALGVS